MFDKKLYLFILIFLTTFSSAFAVEGGYFDTQNGSEYLGFANMNKEFKITSLMNSAIANDYKATKIFIASGADVNETNIAKVSALHLASRNFAYESAQVLIENGANVNAKDSEGWTPLMRASLNGDEKLMNLLIENGANLWIKNIYGDTALVHAAMANCYECGKLLLEKSDTPKSLINNQVNKALDITKKRYNEPFIELLAKYASSGETLNLPSPTNTVISTNNESLSETEEKITRIIYKFLGKSINTSDFDQISKSFKADQKVKADQKRKIQPDNIKSVEDKKISVEDKKMIKSFNFTGRKEKIATLENDLKQNNEVTEDTKKIEETKKVKPKKIKDTKNINKKFIFNEGKKPEENKNIDNNIDEKETKLEETEVIQNNISNEKKEDLKSTNEQTDNNDIKTQTKEVNDAVEKESKNYKIKSIKKDTAPISNDEEELTSEKVYNLQSDKNTLN